MAWEDRPGVELDRHPVVGPERVEIKRGHDRGHRRTRRLVPADFQPVCAVADVIGVVDDVAGKKAKAFFEGAQGSEISRHAPRLAPSGRHGEFVRNGNFHRLLGCIRRIEPLLRGADAGDVGDRPAAKCLDRRDQALTEFGQRIGNAGRDGLLHLCD